MSRETWLSIKNSKSFYVSSYRRACTLVIGSLVINLALISGIYYAYFNQPEREYYASNGVTPPMLLSPRDTPNDSSAALLPPDPVNAPPVKLIPE